jgi:hypothetical protein
MIPESEPHEHWMSAQLRHRLHPSAAIVAKGFFVSSSPR